MTSEVFFVRREQTGNFQAAEQIIVIDLHGVGEVEINFRQKKVYFRKDDVYGDLETDEDYSTQVAASYMQRSARNYYYPEYLFCNPMSSQIFTLVLCPSQRDRCTTYVVFDTEQKQLGGLIFTGKGIPYRVLKY